jgi:hypothetical protein
MVVESTSPEAHVREDISRYAVKPGSYDRLSAFQLSKFSNSMNLPQRTNSSFIPSHFQPYESNNFASASELFTNVDLRLPRGLIKPQAGNNGD